MTVDAWKIENTVTHILRHEVTVRIKEDGSHQYVANRILFADQLEMPFYKDRLL